MSRYKLMSSSNDISDLDPNSTKTWYKSKRNRFYIIGDGLMLNWDRHMKRVYYYIHREGDWSFFNRSGIISSVITKEEFRIQVKIRKTKVWQAMYGEE